MDKIMIFIHKHHDAFVLFTLKLMKNFHSSRFWLIIASILKISVIEESKLGGKFWADIEKKQFMKKKFSWDRWDRFPFQDAFVSGLISLILLKLRKIAYRCWCSPFIVKTCQIPRTANQIIKVFWAPASRSSIFYLK